MSDIILNGVSIAELKKQKALIQKDAAEFIANAIEEVKGIVSKIVEMPIEDTDEWAKKAIELLASVDVVAGVGGVEYYLDYNSEDGETGDNVLSTKLQEFEGETGYEWERLRQFAVCTLIGTLEDMEYTVRDWNTSTC